MRQFLKDTIIAACNAVYKAGAPIKGAIVERLLKEFSLVPTLCTIPAFEGMFPNEHDDIIRLLLFRLAEWHALAKLRLHTDDSLDKLDQALTALGKQLRRFQQFTCSAFQAMELPHEVTARQRRQDANLQSTRGEARSSGAHPKNFNILTYKLHALGDYTASIRLFGTTDSYTTQIGELAHRLIKMLYQSTNKQDTSKQLARQERRCTRIQRHQSSTTLLHDIHTNTAYLGEHKDNPAIKDFIPKLKDHLLSRLLGLDYDGDEWEFSNAQQGNILFINNLSRVSQAKRLQINYTTYDVRRDQDTLKPGCGCAVMMLLREQGTNPHPFWYAHVLGAFCIQILHVGPDARNRSPQSMEFLWIRWLGIVPHYQWGLKEGWLPKVGFIPDSPATFGFLDPSLALRACHLIPAFADGCTDDLLHHGPTVARPFGEVDDWTAFYVNIFADRDMYAHFARIGVGHQIQYVLLNATDDDIFVGDPSNDDEPLDEGDMGPTASNIIEPNSQSDVWDDEDDDTSAINSDDEHGSSEDYGESEDEGPDFKF
ncbi:hypothetical protein BD769DRAFT_1673787 [Suillus cothurnatus]|nr:hypothetical protein BD769DRAFT_1673787 [Suillus cothurnatus]